MVKPQAQARQRGYALILAILGVTLLGIFLLMARAMWETEVQRDQELELMYRGRQYADAIDAYSKKHGGAMPENLEVLAKEKFIRRLYPDPLTADGIWSLVYRDAQAGSEKKLLVAPLSMAANMRGRGVLVGVCSNSPESSFRIYRGKKKYNQWAFYVGDNPKEEMPELVPVSPQQ